MLLEIHKFIMARCTDQGKPGSANTSCRDELVALLFPTYQFIISITICRSPVERRQKND